MRTALERQLQRGYLAAGLRCCILFEENGSRGESPEIRRIELVESFDAWQLVTTYLAAQALLQRKGPRELCFFFLKKSIPMDMEQRFFPAQCMRLSAHCTLPHHICLALGLSEPAQICRGTYELCELQSHLAVEVHLRRQRHRIA